MFKSEVTNRVINIFLLLVFVSIIIFHINVSALAKAIAISFLLLTILSDINKIIKIKQLKAD